MRVVCKVCGQIKTMTMDQLEDERWKVTKSSVTCSSCHTEHEVNKQLERDKKYQIGKVRTQTAKLLQLYIRMLFAVDERPAKYVRNGTVESKRAPLGYVVCVTCGTLGKFNDGMHGGHYIGRAHLGTLLSIPNIHPQCVNCNEYDKTKASVAYDLFMTSVYGQERVDELRMNSKDAGPTREHCAQLKVELRIKMKGINAELSRRGITWTSCQP